MTLEYHLLDVFTTTPFGGNPLAVVLGAEDLSTEQLQLLAREFNLSETTFPLAADEAEGARGVDYRLRIFTVAAELPFAGHPSVGAAWLMARLGRVRPGRVVQACGAGDLPLEVAPDGGPVRLDGGRPSWSEPLDSAPALAAVGLVADDLVGGGRQARECTVGLPYVVLPVHAGSLARCEPDFAGLRSFLPTGILVAAWDAATASARVRMFVADLPAAEDPATGSAALALGVWLVADGVVSAPTAYTVLQGVEMGRPSTLRCSVDVNDGRPVATTVEGDVVHVATGQVQVPPAR